MGEEEARAQRICLLLELDDQKDLVARLTERNTRDREAFHAFAAAFLASGRYEARGDQLIIEGRPYPLAIFDVIAAIGRRKELAEAERRLKELQARAAALGIRLS